jgi:hypothetical protein
MNGAYRFSGRGALPARFLIIILLCCGMYVTAAAQAGAENKIGEVRGRVMLKRAGWNNFVRAVVGMPVRNGDLLQLDKNASAKVACANLKVQDIRERRSRVRCETDDPVLRFKHGIISGPRMGPAVALFPVLVSPRMTKLLDPHPMVRWLPMAGATTYRVSVMRGATELWAQEVSGVTELKYPESAPALVPGVTYKAVITANDQSSTEENLPNLGFTVLDQEQSRAVRESERRIRDLGLPEVSTKLLIADLYAAWGVNLKNPRDDSWGLNTEAIELLEAAPASQQDAAVMRSLGDLYLSIGLTVFAEARYMRALELTEADDVYGEALAQYDIGHIFTIRFNAAEARKRLHKARELFQSFGDTESVQKVNNELSELER